MKWNIMLWWRFGRVSLLACDAFVCCRLRAVFSCLVFNVFGLLNNLTDEIYTAGRTRKVLVLHTSPFSNRVVIICVDYLKFFHFHFPFTLLQHNVNTFVDNTSSFLMQCIEIMAMHYVTNCTLKPLTVLRTYLLRMPRSL